MTLTLNSSTEARLLAEAARRGLAPDAVIDALLDEARPSPLGADLGASVPTPEELGWSNDFLARTAGGWQGEPLERESQGTYEEREPLQ